MKDAPNPESGPSAPATPPAAETARAHVWVWGRVQGVGFRMYAEFEATRRKLTGWVRNSDDDKVECVFEGPRPDVEAAVAWCRKGPPGGRVSGMQVEWEKPTGESDGFSIRHSVTPFRG